eukprot:TRINITY_DN2325_c0_g1_i1.p1 TRINITY_DN2325_c0_g1~~TRINITY_DN2325_c0_g1_i1.p1  ORF type:complete len:514 (+),score=183.65 TRINITY_DN2325_c0_g1_i1:147-1544(+)
MCVTTELNSKMDFKGASKRDAFNRKQAEGEPSQYLPRQSKNITYVSRLQCVQAAVEQQIQKVAKEHPKKKIGIITFNNEVNIIGDGTQEEKVVAGDILNSWNDLKQIGENYKIAKSVGDAESDLLKKLWELEESGATALGPALLLGITIAGSHAASKVILCTDGLANLGLGSIENKVTEYSPYYTELAEAAKLKGVTVSVISLTGTDCALENLSVVAEQTAGEVERVDPLKLTKNFASILAKPILATGCMATILLHKGLMFRGEVDDEEDRNWIVKDLANVTVDTQCTFAYAFRSKNEIDLSHLTEIPFQVQVVYTKLNGVKCLRVVTDRVKVTDKREEAEKNANIKVIGTFAAQRSAKYAKEGDYEKAQMETRAAQRLMMRNFDPETNKDIKVWSKNVEVMDKEIRRVKEKVDDTCNSSASSEVKCKSRAQARKFDDSVTVAISKNTNVGSKKLFVTEDGEDNS